MKTRNLIKQQAKAIDKLTDLRIGKYDGTLNNALRS